MNGRVLVVGSVNIDLVATVERLPTPGETVTGATFARHHGGKGGNQAVAAARLGARVAFVGAVGDDALADEAREALELEGVDVTGLATVAGPTGVALILVDRRGENAIAVASGANGAVTPELVEAALDRLAVRPDDVVLVGHEIPTTAVGAALRAARAAGATSILNPAPATGLDPSTIGLADVIVPNRGELAELAGGGDDPVTSAPILLSLLQPRSTRAIVVTLGAGGALLVRRDADPVRFAAPAVEVVDTVGAGDTFTGALAADVAAGIPFETAVRRAVAAASLSTAVAGARSGMPTRSAVATLLGDS